MVCQLTGKGVPTKEIRLHGNDVQTMQGDFEDHAGKMIHERFYDSGYHWLPWLTVFACDVLLYVAVLLAAVLRT